MYFFFIFFSFSVLFFPCNCYIYMYICFVIWKCWHVELVDEESRTELIIYFLRGTICSWRICTEIFQSREFLTWWSIIVLCFKNEWMKNKIIDTTEEWNERKKRNLLFISFRWFLIFNENKKKIERRKEEQKRSKEENEMFMWRYRNW